MAATAVARRQHCCSPSAAPLVCQVCDLPLCRVLVVDDASYPCWIVLVPRVNHCREVIQLSEEQQAALWREVAATAQIIQVGTGQGLAATDRGVPASQPLLWCPPCRTCTAPSNST
jgi:diadenosine tetraphosphate (Ap4A) HIT family hydrolase